MEIHFQPWSHHYGSSNAESFDDGSAQFVEVDGESFGCITMSGGKDYIVTVGDYPGEKTVGCFRTERKAHFVMMTQIWAAKEARQ